MASDNPQAATPSSGGASRSGEVSTPRGDGIPEKIGRLAVIPSAETELRRMAALIGPDRSQIMVGASANEKALRERALDQYALLAFATHGLMAGEISPYSEPGLVLTPVGWEPEEDGFLTASEIAGLTLDADFVVLSACNTGAGDDIDPAEGLSGLTRAFFYAGARSLLVSHWPVLDEVAPRLTVRMLELMTQNPGASAASALQQAMREVRNDATQDDWAHPAAWAPFSVVGDGAGKLEGAAGSAPDARQEGMH